MTPNRETATALADVLAALSPASEVEKGMRLTFDLLTRWCLEVHGMSIDAALDFANQFETMVVAALEENRRAPRH